jgi:oligogalacturonide transport system permease protein
METNSIKPSLPAKKEKHVKHRLTNRARESLSGYFFILFWIVGICVFTFWPLIQAFYYSLCEATFSGNQIVTKFQWFQNFVYAFREDSNFPSMLVSYLTEIVVQVPFTVTVSLIIAMLLNQKIKLRAMWRVIFFLPVIIISGPVVQELIDQGATTIQVFQSGGFMTFVTTYLPSVISQIITLLFNKLIVVLWYSGIPILIFLAGLQKISKSVYEAAAIDGASGWQTFWKITLPAMSPFILVNAIYMIVALSSTSLASSSKKTIITYIQEQISGGVGGKGYGYACCLGVIYLFVILIHIGIYALIFMPKPTHKKRG